MSRVDLAMLDCNVELRRSRFSLQASFHLSGGAMGVFGPSGAGKSTLLHLIAGLVRPDAGRIVLNNRVLTDCGRSVFEPPYRRRVGLVFQDAQLLPHLKVEENLLFGFRRTPVGDRRFSLGAIVDLLGIEHLRQARPVELSGGERQRVALARALLASPELLLLDEPLAALDQRLRKQIIAYLKSVRDQLKLPMVYVSHSAAEILELCDSVTVLQNGHVTQCGATEAVFAQSSVVGLNNVLRVRISGHDIAGSCTFCDAEGSELVLPLNQQLNVGDFTYITIDEQDIAISTHRIEGVSIQNQLSGYVLSIANTGGHVQIGVDVGPLLWTEITARALSRLNLMVGDQIWCLIKTQSIRYVSDG